MLFDISHDIVEYRCEHFAGDYKADFEIILIAKQSHDHLSEGYILIAIDLLGVMVGNKGPIQIHFY